ncbi:MAG: hypothetical protein ACD_37C00327G0004 [uncultured bacterium]|nr:MAG: hypothetical protein ACD_37C00327G0004 [uncultured bacterium]
MARKKEPKITITSFVLSRSLLSKIIALLLRLLILVILIGFLGGILKTLWDLKLLLDHSVEEALRQLLLNVITLLAVVEVVKTSLSYLSDGRVRVTFIVDTVLIVMLNEIISSWFKGVSIQTWMSLLIIVLMLIVVRIFAIRFSPDTD